MRARVASFVVRCALPLGFLGCARSYARVYLDPTVVDDPKRNVEAVCVRSDQPSGDDTKILLGPRRQLLRDPTGSVAPPDRGHDVAYLVGPPEPPGSRRTESPLLISGGVIGLTGVAAAALGALATFGCAESEGCNTAIPGGIAVAGLGLAVTGGVLAIVGAVDPKLGTHPIEDHIDDRGRGHVCNPDL